MEQINLQFRIHRAFSDVSGVVVSLLEKCNMGFVFEHPADEDVNRTHIHGYMFGSELLPKTVSQDWIKKKLSLKGNTDFGVSDKCSKTDKRPLDLSGAFCYGSKWDTIAASHLKNIPPAILDKLRSYSRSKGTFNNIASKSAPTTQVVVLKEVKVKTKPTLYQHVQACATSITDARPDIYKADVGDLRRQVFELSFSYIQSHELFMGKYKQLDFLDMVLTKLNCAEYKNMLFHDFLKRTSFDRI